MLSLFFFDYAVFCYYVFFLVFFSSFFFRLKVWPCPRS
jgi:hypothetical protein